MTTETFSEIGVNRPSIAKDPNAVLDYTFDWTDWLAEGGDSIGSVEVTCSGVTKNSSSQVGPLVTVWVSGGTAGAVASIGCTITTVGSPTRVERRSIYLNINRR